MVSRRAWIQRRVPVVTEALANSCASDATVSAVPAAIRTDPDSRVLGTSTAIYRAAFAMEWDRDCGHEASLVGRLDRDAGRRNRCSHRRVVAAQGAQPAARIRAGGLVAV